LSKEDYLEDLQMLNSSGQIIDIKTIYLAIIYKEWRNQLANKYLPALQVEAFCVVNNDPTHVCVANNDPTPVKIHGFKFGYEKNCSFSINKLRTTSPTYSNYS